MAVDGPLTNVRVLDLSRLLPGPYCSRILADFGAEVIKVERPGGSDWMRHLPPLAGGKGLLFQFLHRGKKSITINLKMEQGRDLFLQMAGTADVVLEGFRPGVMERLGLGYDVLAASNPRLVYCSLSGYGPDGPYRERAGHDLNYVGLAGLLDLTGRREGPPVLLGAPVADLAGALWAAVGILIALMARGQTGRGQRVDASLLGGALSFLPFALARLQGGEPMARGSSDLTGGSVCYQVYETRDGEYVTFSALEPEFWAAFCRAVGRDDLLEQRSAPAIPGEPAYEAICAVFRTRTRQEWVDSLADVDACCEPVYALDEALAAPSLQALGMVSENGLLPPVRLSAGRGVRSSPVPALGEHTGALLRELGCTDDDVEHLRAGGIV